jgi:hypothetical protein
MKDLIQSIESRFQILITLSIFFPSLIYYLGKATGQTDGQLAIAMLQFGGLIGLVIVDYIIFQSSKRIFSAKWLGWINKVLLWSFIFFAAPILALAILPSLKFTVPTWIANITGLALGTLIVIILAIPVAIELLLIIFSILSERNHGKGKKH